MGKRTDVINEHVVWSIAASLVPLPVIDLLAVTAVQLDMLKQLAGLYNTSISDSEGKAWVSALAGNALARIAASGIKLIPGIGSLIGGLSLPILSGASTYALGKVAVEHFNAGHGTLANADFGQARRRYEEELEKGKVVAADLAREKKASFDRIEQLGVLKDKGLITAEEFEKQKQQILAAA
jgi:uncharacterized protein (DUF697 family)